MGSRNTPGPAGYAMAVVVSVIAYSALLSLPAIGDIGPVWPVFALTISLWVGIYGLPIGAVGLAVVHLCCRRVRSQAIHVGAAAVAGLIAGMVFWGSSQAGPLAAQTWLLALAAGLGRVAVIPLVRRRRTADDFAAAPAGW